MSYKKWLELEVKWHFNVEKHLEKTNSEFEHQEMFTIGRPSDYLIFDIIFNIYHGGNKLLGYWIDYWGGDHHCKTCDGVFVQVIKLIK